MAHIQLNGPRAREQFPLDGLERVVIGRDEQCEIVLDDSTSSRAHALLERVGPAWTITDLNSRNGTLVQGERVVGARRLKHGDEIEIGRTTLRYLDADDVVASHTETVVDERPKLTRTEFEVLLELCRPLYTPGSAFKVPASVAAIAAARVVGSAAVRMTLGTLYDKFGVDEGPERLVRLAEAAVQRGVISERHYWPPQDRRP